MTTLLSALGSDITAWRPAANFAVMFRQALLDRCGECSSQEAEELFAGVERLLGTCAAGHVAFRDALDGLIRELEGPSPPDPLRLREIIGAHFTLLYGHFDRYHAARVFFESSGTFLHALTGAISRRAELAAGGSLPRMALVVLGPAGRREFSPFCPLQLALIHDAGSDRETAALFRYCQALLEGYEACGLVLDKDISLTNQAWNASLATWEDHLGRTLARGSSRDLVNLFRLADQEILLSPDGLGEQFRSLLLSHLRESTRGIADLIHRLQALPAGLGLMGGFRLERSGPRRGMFKLFDYALLPFSMVVTALALLHGIDATGTFQRIREMLDRRVLNVETAERLLHAWHVLNESRLLREQGLFPGWSDDTALYLDLNSLGEELRKELGEALETIENVRRQASVMHTGWESARS
jgi:hypothetical protein